MNRHLQSENFSLRQQLECLLHEARLNEDKMRRFDQLQRLLIGAGSLAELVRLLLSEYKLAFGVEFVSLMLVDEEYEIARILDDGQDGVWDGLLLRPSTGPFEGPFLKKRLFIGAFDAASHGALFDSAPGEVASVALLPLIRHGELIGGFCLGSANPSRYVQGCGTDFLERLSEIIAICLDNALAQERLQLAGLTDMLTGVHNRRFFDHRYQSEISQARRHRQPLACMFLDIDHFKRVNDTHGHQVGDEALKIVAAAIKSQLRTADAVARYGGEEFVVLLPQTGGQQARQIAERIRRRIETVPVQTQSGQQVALTISIGLAMLDLDHKAASDKQLAEELISAADNALYRAKHGGRNRVVCADEQRPASVQPAFWRVALRPFVAGVLRLAGTVAGGWQNLKRAGSRQE